MSRQKLYHTYVDRCLNAFGGIQPGPLSSYVYQAVQDEQGADGLLQRFQLTVWPDPPKSWRNVDRYPTRKPRTECTKCSRS